MVSQDLFANKIGGCSGFEVQGVFQTENASYPTPKWIIDQNRDSLAGRSEPFRFPIEFLFRQLTFLRFVCEI